MKKISILIMVLLMSSFLFATTYTTVTLDGIIDEWDADEAMGAEVFDSKNFTLWFTWDATNLYVGLERETADWFLGDNAGNLSLFVAFDTDQILNSGGASDGYGRVNFANATYLPDHIFYYAGGAGWYESSSWNVGGSAWDWNGWSDVGTYYGWEAAHQDDEISVPFANIGSPTALAVYVWFTEEGGTDIQASWPVENPIGTSPNFDYFYIFNDLGTGVVPNDPSHTLPVELSAFTAVYMNEFVNVSWQTATETDVIGYNIFRSEEDDFSTVQKVNTSIIPGHGTTTTPQSYEFTDVTADPYYTTYYYWLEVVNFGGTNNIYGSIEFAPVDVDQNGEMNIITSNLLPSFPNPVKMGQSVSFSFCLGGLEGTVRPVQLNIYNVLGQLVAEVVNDERVVNNYTVEWNTEDFGRGIYFYQLKTEDYQETKKLMID